MAGISIKTNFDLGANLPIDSRLVIDSLANLYAAGYNENNSYIGMIVYVSDEEGYYKLKDYDGTSGTASTASCWIKLSALDDNPTIEGTVEQAEKDGEGQVIADTYVKNISVTKATTAGTTSANPYDTYTIKYTNGSGTESNASVTIKDTQYVAATSSKLGLVKIGNNITNSSGTISVTKTNVTSALGYTPVNIAGDAMTGPLTLSGNPTSNLHATTKQYVDTAIDEAFAANDAMVFKGTIGTGGTVTSLPTTYNTGWTYRVITAGEYAGQECEVGDLIIALVDRTGTGNLDSDWTVAQTNIEGNPIMNLTAGTGISITGTGSSRTIGHSNAITAGTVKGDNNKTLTFGGTFTIPSITYDAQGHITSTTTTTMTMPTNPNVNAHLYVGASNTAVANAAATNGNVYLNLTNGTTISESHNIVGSGLTTITSDANGKITITTNHATVSTSNTTSTQSATHGGTVEVIDSITTNNGHITAVNTKTVTLPTDNDTKNTAGSTNTSSKIFLIGATTQTANPQTYSHDTAYVGTDGCLYSNNEKVATTTDLGNYLPLTGGTITDGDKTLSITPNGITGNRSQSLTGIGSISMNGILTLNDEEKLTINSWGISGNGNQIIEGIADITTEGLIVTNDADIKSKLNVGGEAIIGYDLRATTIYEDGTELSEKYAAIAHTHGVNGLNIGQTNVTNYATCSTAAATAAKTVTCSGFYLATGSKITVKFTITNTASSPTLNVNSTGAKPIYYRGSAISTGYLAANRTYTFVYNGTQYELIGDINTTSTDTKVTQTVDTSNTSIPILMAYQASPTSGTASTAKYATGVTINPSTKTIAASILEGDLSTDYLTQGVDELIFDCGGAV